MKKFLILYFISLSSLDKLVSSFMMLHNNYHYQSLFHHDSSSSQKLPISTSSITLLKLNLQPPNLSHGETIFQQTCSSCHAGGSNVIAKEKTLYQDALIKFLAVENEEGISNFVKDSNIHRGALAFSGKLSEQDYEDVAAFVYKQAMEDKW